MGKLKENDPIPRGHKDEVEYLIRVALALGWSANVSSKDVVAIHAPHPHEGVRHTFRPGQAHINRPKVIESVLAHGDPKKVEEFTKMREAEQAGFLKNGTTINKMFDDGAANAEAAVDSFIDEDDLPKPEPKRRHIVSKKPMTAKASEGRGYESKIAEERHWSDGSIDYKCMLCEYHSDNRLSLRGHRQKHINSGEVETLSRDARGDGTFEAEVPNAATYNPRRTRVEALALVLAGILKQGITDPEEIALQALTWVHHQTKHNTSESESHDRENLTSDEVLAMIKTLVGGDGTEQQAGQIERLELLNTQLTTRLTVTEEEVETLNSEIEKVQAERDTCATELQRVRGDLNGLEELIRGIRGE